MTLNVNEIQGDNFIMSPSIKPRIWFVMAICYSLPIVFQIVSGYFLTDIDWHLHYLIELIWFIYSIPGLILASYYGFKGVISNAFFSLVVYFTIQSFHKTLLNNTSSKLILFISVLIINIAFSICIGILAEKLKKSLFKIEIYESMVQHHIDAVISTNLHGNIKFVNSASEKLTGYSSKEFHKKPFTCLVHPKDLEKANSIFEIAKNGESIIFELTFIHKDGMYYEVSAKCLPVIVRNKVIEVFVVFRNITDKKNKELSFSSIFEFHPHFIVKLDLNGNILDCNSAAEKITGYRKEEFIGKFIFEIIAPEELEHSRNCLNETLNGEKLNYDRVIIHKNGQRIHLNTTTVPIYSKNSSTMGIFAIGKDITEHKIIEQALLEKNEIFKNVFQDSQNIMFLSEYSDDGFSRIVEVNLAAYQKLGYSCAEFKEITCVDIIHLQNEDEKVYLMKKLRSEGYFIRKTHLLTKNNEKVPVEVRCSIIKALGKKLIYTDACEITEEYKLHVVNKDDPGINLRMVMSELNITASNLAEKTGLSRATISNLRNGKISKPQSFTAKSVADALGVNINDLWPK